MKIQISSKESGGSKVLQNLLAWFLLATFNSFKARLQLQVLLLQLLVLLKYNISATCRIYINGILSSAALLLAGLLRLPSVGVAFSNPWLQFSVE
jgi:hypothetical protein